MDRRISIKGTGKISVSVDYVEIRITVEGKNKKYEKAVLEATELVSEIDKNLAKVGFEKNDLKTEQYGVQKDYSYMPNKRGIGIPDRKESGFVCRHNLKLEFDFENKKLIDAVVAITNCISESKIEVLFTVKDKNAVNEQLLSSVSMNARQKAEILCSAAGSKLGQLIKINYNWEERELFSKSQFFGNKAGFRLPQPQLSSSFQETTVLGQSSASLAPILPQPVDIRPDDIILTDSAMFVWEIL